MLDSNVDDQLSALGQAPTDMRELVARVLGDQPLTLAHADALLASLAEGRALPEPSSLRGVLGALGVFSGIAAVATPQGESPLTASAAPLFDSRPPPPSTPPPVFETGPVPADSDPSSMFDGRPDAETTAQAIVAAFDDPDAEAGSSPHEQLDPLASALLELGSNPPLEIAPERRARRGETRGSRRPDLDDLLDQPLDALDFERTEPVPPDTTSTEGSRASNAPTGAPPASGTSGDDFEILVDDEILEIAEDDVELVDDDSSN